MRSTHKGVNYTVDAVRQPNGTFRWRFDALLNIRHGDMDLATEDLAISIGRERAIEYIDSQVKS